MEKRSIWGERITKKKGIAKCLNNMGEMLFRAAKLKGAEQNYHPHAGSF